MADVSQRVDGPRSHSTEPLESDKSLGELLSQLSADFGELVSAQVELAKVELKDEARTAGRSAGMFGGAAVAGHLALLLLSMAAAWGLAEVMPEGWAFLIVGVVWAMAAGALFVVARKQMREIEPVPETRESMKEDVQWARQQMS
jgi:uncharacterized membrane protein YqjE